VWLRRAIIIWFFFACWPVSAGLYVNTISPGNVPWPGGTVPYVIDPALSAAQRQTYLNGLREYELAANVHFIPRTSETQYVFFKYDPAGPNLVSGSNPQLVEINLLTRGQICHEMGHSFGLLHEHVRGDRNTYVNVLSANITSGNEFYFDIDPNATAHSSYDFESVMHFSRDVFSVQPGVLDTLQAKPGFERFQPRMAGLALSKGDRAVMKFLYGAGPTLSPVVTNTSESGAGGLRAALHYATDTPGTTITFNIPTSDPSYANGVFTIRLTGHLLPFVIDGTIIDGTTQPGYAGSPLIVLDGSQILPEAGSVPGMFVYAANCTVKGLSFERFPWVGLAFLFPDAHDNAVRGCWFGLDYSGTASAPNQYQGIFISSGAYSNTIGGTTAAARNVISGNNEYGIWISGANTTGNVVLGNYIGTSASGLAAVPNGIGGLIVTDSSHDNSIGGTSSGARNVISGNVNAGVWLTGAGVNQNTVRGNYIGLAATGAAAVPNTFAGLYILNGAQNNLVADNVISGNASEGLRIADKGSSGNLVQGNFIGTNAAGTAALANGYAGVAIFAGAASNTVGGLTTNARNIISGNGSHGVAIGDAGTNLNLVRGNYIGVNAAGSGALSNGFVGVNIFGGAQSNTIGGNAAGAGNVISANTFRDVQIDGAGTNANVVAGNLIGLNAIGLSAIPNNNIGIGIFAGAQSNVIGGTGAGSRNFISGHAQSGILIDGPGASGNLVQGNTIGLNLAGSAAPNTGPGVAFGNSAQSNTLGGSAIGASNIISGNTNEGVAVYSFNSTTIRDAISRNSIFANGGKGIALYNGGNNTQPAPAISSAILGTATNTGGTNVAGSLTAAATTLYAIEFFASPAGGDEGQFFVGSTTASTNGAGTVNFTANLASAIPAGYVVTATATDPNGNTSEFSATRTVTTIDADGDGMPDNWENAHLLNASSSTDANIDSDGDGFTNLQEFRTGTDPQLSTSRFAISSIDRTAGNPRINFQALAGKTYRLEYRDDLVSGNWGTLVDQIFSAGAATLQIVDPGAALLSQRFYRLTSEP
jgi:hypothetical protein